MLLNARRRRKTRSRKRTRENPSTASYRRNFDAIFKRRGGKTRRGVRRARRLSIKKYSLGGNRQGLVVRARKIYVTRRGRKSALIVARNPRRRRRINPFIPSMGGITGQIKGLFSKENLTIAAGGVASTVVTQYALNLKSKDGKSLLPMPTDPNMAKVAAIAYAVGIPFTAALLTRKFSPGAAKGMVFGGLINGIMTAWRNYAGDSLAAATGNAPVAPVKEYLQYTPTSAVGAMPPGYMASTRFDSVRPMNGALNNNSAFPADAWGAN